MQVLLHLCCSTALAQRCRLATYVGHGVGDSCRHARGRHPNSCSRAAIANSIAPGTMGVGVAHVDAIVEITRGPHCCREETGLRVGKPEPIGVLAQDTRYASRRRE
ncbi:hypothetical protein C8Q72DRAFT_867333 [Fomitopsis betulina]|nr:hypothetical protein C8Q72DRAFT_867333 [Fomitopsis betulina]